MSSIRFFPLLNITNTCCPFSGWLWWSCTAIKMTTTRSFCENQRLHFILSPAGSICSKIGQIFYLGQKYKPQRHKGLFFYHVEQFFSSKLWAFPKNLLVFSGRNKRFNGLCCLNTDFLGKGLLVVDYVSWVTDGGNKYYVPTLWLCLFCLSVQSINRHHPWWTFWTLRFTSKVVWGCFWVLWNLFIYFYANKKYMSVIKLIHPSIHSILYEKKN